MVGYSLRLLHGNRKASKKRIEVVEKLGVSRQSVYNWFLGKHEPSPTQAAKISQLFSVL
jgi:DNA-binding XRE family transcriptional regulator